MSTIELPDGVRSVEMIEDSGPLVSLTKEVDLDDLALFLAANDGEWNWSGESYGRDDEPTAIFSTDPVKEAQVGWFRKTFCRCMGYHSWDMQKVSDEKPEGNKARGAFLGVWFA